MKNWIQIAVFAGIALASGGCVGGPSTELTQAEKASFKGKPPTNEQRSAMQKSIEEYKRTHTNIPPRPGDEGSGTPPTGAVPPEALPNR